MANENSSGTGEDRKMGGSPKQANRLMKWAVFAIFVAVLLTATGIHIPSAFMTVLLQLKTGNTRKQKFYTFNFHFVEKLKINKIKKCLQIIINFRSAWFIRLRVVTTRAT
jgi:hypothetical protein